MAKKVLNKKKIKEHISSTAHGRVLSLAFFKKYLFQIVFVIALIMMYVSSRYDYKTSMEETVKLTNELNVARTEMQEEKSLYMSLIRESSMQAIVDTLHLNLAIRERPPIQLNY